MEEEKRHKTRRTADEVHADLLSCKTEMGQQMEILNEKIIEHTEAFDAFKEDFNEVITILRDGRGFFRYLRYIGTGFKWIASILAPLIGLWYFITHGQWPK